MNKTKAKKPLLPATTRGFTKSDGDRIVGKLLRWDAAYHRGTPEVSDAKYDKYRDMLARGAPDHPYLKKVGAPVAKTAANERARSRKEKLPFMVGSLDKARPADLSRWMEAIASKQAQKCWLVSPKFDGASVSLRYVDGRLDRAWTRGDGVEGQVVTAAARHVQGVLQTMVPNKAFSNKGTFVVRGEVVMHRSIFDKFYAPGRDDSGLGKTYKTPRNMVTGLLNRIDVSEVERDLKRCTFVALSIFHEDRKLGWVRPFDAHAEWVHLLMSGFTTATNPQRYAPAHKKILDLVRAGHGGLRKMLPVHPVEGGLGDLAVLDHIPTAEEVVSIMRAIYKTVDVPCDGIVVQPVSNRYWQRRGGQLEDRPPFMVAVKLDAHEQESAVGTIGEVEWNVSKRGLLKPRLILKTPLNFDGVEVTYATANNAAFVKKWGLRAGRKIKLVRSGDVIPRVVAVRADDAWHPLSLRKKVKVGSETRLKLVDGPGIDDPRAAKSLPRACPACSSKLRWTPKGTDLECTNTDCDSRRDRSVAAFFRTLGVDDVASGTVNHLIESGLDTVPKILRGATAKALRRLEKYGDKKATIVSSAIAGSLKDKPLAVVMHASGVFSTSEFALGSTRLQAIVDHVGAGGVARGSEAGLRRKLATLSGLGKAGLDLFLKKLPAWRKFYAEIADMHEESAGPKTLRGVRVAFTSFRDPEAEAYVVKHGGSVGGVSKKTTVLFAASLSSGKAKKADSLDIPVVAKAKMWDWLKKRGGE